MRARWTGIPLIISDFFTDPGESDSVFRKVSTQSCLSEQADMANIDSSDDLGTTTIVLLILFTFLASLTVWARFWSRSTKKMSPGADDYVVLTGLVGLPMLFSVTSYRSLPLLSIRPFRGVSLFRTLWAALRRHTVGICSL